MVLELSGGDPGSADANTEAVAEDRPQHAPPASTPPTTVPGGSESSGGSFGRSNGKRKCSATPKDKAPHHRQEGCQLCLLLCRDRGALSPWPPHLAEQRVGGCVWCAGRSKATTTLRRTPPRCPSCSHRTSTSTSTSRQTTPPTSLLSGAPSLRRPSRGCRRRMRSCRRRMGSCTDSSSSWHSHKVSSRKGG